MKNIKIFEDFLIEKYGVKRTSERCKFDSASLSYRLGVMLKEARKSAKSTQEKLTERTQG